MRERRFEVSKDLRAWLSDISVLSLGGIGAPGTQTSVPDNASALVFRATAEGQGDLVAVGPRTRARYFADKDLPLCIRIRIRQGRACALLGTPASALVDRVVPLAELWGLEGDSLARELSEPPHDGAAVVRRIESALRARLPALTPGDVSRSELVHAATRSARSLPVRATADRLNVSERHLRKLFVGDVGVTPKHFARIDRVRSVLARLGQERSARIATDTGYYDQSHMTAEFRDIMGLPPGAFSIGQRPVPQVC